MATEDNLQEAFAGESQANRKYLAFAKKADEEGKPQVAKLFRAAAAAETVHAHAHLRVMGGIQGTAENLEAAIEGEGHEYKTMYPDFLAEAEAEGNKPATLRVRDGISVPSRRGYFAARQGARRRRIGNTATTRDAAWRRKSRAPSGSSGGGPSAALRLVPDLPGSPPRRALHPDRRRPSEMAHLFHRGP